MTTNQCFAIPNSFDVRGTEFRTQLEATALMLMSGLVAEIATPHRKAHSLCPQPNHHTNLLSDKTAHGHLPGLEAGVYALANVWEGGFTLALCALQGAQATQAQRSSLGAESLVLRDRDLNRRELHKKVNQ